MLADTSRMHGTENLLGIGSGVAERLGGHGQVPGGQAVDGAGHLDGNAEGRRRHAVGDRRGHAAGKFGFASEAQTERRWEARRPTDRRRDGRLRPGAAAAKASAAARSATPTVIGRSRNTSTSWSKVASLTGRMPQRDEHLVAVPAHEFRFRHRLLGLGIDVLPAESARLPADETAAQRQFDDSAGPELALAFHDPPGGRGSPRSDLTRAADDHHVIGVDPWLRRPWRARRFGDRGRGRQCVDGSIHLTRAGVPGILGRPRHLARAGETASQQTSECPAPGGGREAAGQVHPR